MTALRSKIFTIRNAHYLPLFLFSFHGPRGHHLLVVSCVVSAQGISGPEHLLAYNARVGNREMHLYVTLNSLFSVKELSTSCAFVLSKLVPSDHALDHGIEI